MAVNLLPKDHCYVLSLGSHSNELMWGFNKVLSFIGPSLDPPNTSRFVRRKEGGDLFLIIGSRGVLGSLLPLVIG